MKIPHLSELRKEYDRSSGRTHILVRIAVWLGALVGIWLLFGFFGVPPILRNQLQQRLTAALQRVVTIQKVAFNPLRFSVSIEGFKVAEQSPAEGTFLGWQKLYVNFDTFSLLRREWRFQTIELNGFEGRLAVDSAGRLNFADLMAKLGRKDEPIEKPKASWPLYIRRLSVDGAHFSYSDASQAEPFRTEIGPTSVVLHDFHTGGKGQAPGEFSATTESGETFKWNGKVSFAPLRSSGDIVVGNLILRKYAPYYASRVRFDLQDGQLDISGHYEFSLENGQPRLRLSQGRGMLKSLKIAPRGQPEPVVVLNQVELADVAATWPDLSADVGRVAVAGGSINVCRKASGIDLVDMFAPLASKAEPPPTVALQAPAQATPAVPPKVKFSTISLRGLNVSVEDQTTPRVAKHEFSELSSDLKDLSLSEPAKPLWFGLRTNYDATGQVHLVGAFTLAPMKLQLNVELDNIALAGLSPYVEQYAKLRVSHGRLSTRLVLGTEFAPDKTPAVSAQCELNVDNFLATDEAGENELMSWRNLSIKGLDYSNEPSKLLITEIYWLEPSGQLVVNTDGSTNFGRAFGLRTSGSEPAPAVAFPASQAATTPTAGPLGDQVVSLDRFVLDKAAFQFTDRSLTPNVHVALNQFSGQIEGLSTSELARASVDIRGRVEGVTPITITGTTNPLSIDAYTDLKVAMKSMDLAPFGPYVGKFAGYEMEHGDLTVDIKCNIRKRKVDSNNVATIDQFTFGNATNSPVATKLPVRLAVALLRDPSGKIVLDVPVQGSLDDPEFHVGRVVWRVIGNLLNKAATSPFALLGSMFGSNKGEELSFQNFLPGQDIPVNDDEIKKLDVVARALKGRPTLRLDIKGGYDESTDAPMLKEQVLEDQMRNIIWNDRRMIDPSITLDQIQVDPVQKNGMIRRLFYLAFPKEKPKHIKPGDPGYTDDAVASQRGDLGAFQRKKKSVAPAPMQRQEITAASKQNSDGTTDSTSEVKEVRTTDFDVMKARLLAQITLTDDAFLRLAADRAKAVRLYLINYGEVPPQRLTVLPITASQPAAKGARVELKLK